MKVLCITSSILKDFSISNTLVKELIEQLKTQHNPLTIIEKNVGEYPPDHLSLAVMTAIKTNDPAPLSQEQKKTYQEILTAIDELKSADLVIIGAPMHNFSITSGLKNWIDQICQAGLTFSYTDQGPKGLVNDKPVIIISTRGGIYSTPPYDAFDHQETYLKAVLGLLGLSDITYIRAEGVNISPEMKQNAIEQASIAIKQLQI